MRNLTLVFLNVCVVFQVLTCYDEMREKESEIVGKFEYLKDDEKFSRFYF